MLCCDCKSKTSLLMLTLLLLFLAFFLLHSDCTKLAAGEKPLQVTHNLQVSDGERGEMTLLRDQIVIQVTSFVQSVFLLESI